MIYRLYQSFFLPILNRKIFPNFVPLYPFFFGAFCKGTSGGKMVDIEFVPIKKLLEDQQ